MSERQFLHFTRTYQYQKNAQGLFEVYQLNPLDKAVYDAKKVVSGLAAVVEFVFECENRLGAFDNACEALECFTDAYQQLVRTIQEVRCLSI